MVTKLGKLIRLEDEGKNSTILWRLWRENYDEINPFYSSYLGQVYGLLKMAIVFSLIVGIALATSKSWASLDWATWGGVIIIMFGLSALIRVWVVTSSSERYLSDLEDLSKYLEIDLETLAWLGKSELCTKAVAKVEELEKEVERCRQTIRDSTPKEDQGKEFRERWLMRIEGDLGATKEMRGEAKRVFRNFGLIEKEVEEQEEIDPEKQLEAALEAE